MRTLIYKQWKHYEILELNWCNRCVKQYVFVIMQLLKIKRPGLYRNYLRWWCFSGHKGAGDSELKSQDLSAPYFQFHFISMELFNKGYGQQLNRYICIPVIYNCILNKQACDEVDKEKLLKHHGKVIGRHQMQKRTHP